MIEVYRLKYNYLLPDLCPSVLMKNKLDYLLCNKSPLVGTKSGTLGRWPLLLTANSLASHCQVRPAERHGGACCRAPGGLRCGAGRASAAVRAGVCCWSHGLRRGRRHHSRGSSQVRGKRRLPNGSAGDKYAWRMFEMSLFFSGNGKLASWTSILGFIVMMSLDVGLG